MKDAYISKSRIDSVAIAVSMIGAENIVISDVVPGDLAAARTMLVNRLQRMILN